MGGPATVAHSGNRLWPGPELPGHLGRLAGRPAAAPPAALCLHRSLARQRRRSAAQPAYQSRTAAPGHPAPCPVVGPDTGLSPPGVRERPGGVDPVRRRRPGHAARDGLRGRQRVPGRFQPAAQPRHLELAHPESRGPALPTRHPRGHLDHRPRRARRLGTVRLCGAKNPGRTAQARQPARRIQPRLGAPKGAGYPGPDSQLLHRDRRRPGRSRRSRQPGAARLAGDRAGCRRRPCLRGLRPARRAAGPAGVQGRQPGLAPFTLWRAVHAAAGAGTAANRPGLAAFGRAGMAGQCRTLVARPRRLGPSRTSGAGLAGPPPHHLARRGAGGPPADDARPLAGAGRAGPGAGPGPAGSGGRRAGQPCHHRHRSAPASHPWPSVHGAARR